MKKNIFLIFLFVLMFPTQARSITWKEFWKPFDGHNHHHNYYRNYNHGYYNQICTKRIYHTESNYGYTRTWSEEVRVPCNRF